MQLGTALDDFDFLTDRSIASSAETGSDTRPAFEPSRDLPRFLTQARDELTREHRAGTRYSVSLPASVEALRWFALPQEITDAGSSVSRVAG